MSDYQEFGDRERAGWSQDDIVDAYVARIGPVTDEVAKVLTVRAAAPGQKVLDLCCGQGTLTAMLCEAGADVTGLDFSPAMLARAARTAPAAALREGDAAALPFEAASFDAVVCNFGMMHLPRQPRVLSEIRRVLRPDGCFVMATWVGPEASPAFGAVLGAIKTHADLSAAPVQPDLFAFARRETAQEMMTGAGLRMTAHEVVTPAYTLSAPEELFEIFATATVGVAMLLKSQSQQVVDAIRSQVADTLARNHAADAGYHVPVPVAVITARPA